MDQRNHDGAASWPPRFFASGVTTKSASTGGPLATDVMVFGAGASHSMGIPLMQGFIDAADELRGSPPQTLSLDAFSHFFELLENHLPRLHQRSVVDLRNIESVFSLVEMGRLVRRLPGIDDNDVESAAAAVRRVLAETIIHTGAFDLVDAQWVPPREYSAIATLGGSSLQSYKPGSTAFITFNYDLGLDFALHWLGLPIDYGLEKSSSGVPLLKLHGSLAWGACTQCLTIVSISFKGIFEANRGIPVSRGPMKRILDPYRAISAFSPHCAGAPLSSEPALVPPTWNKTQYHKQFASVWARAASEIASAKNITVIGYSMPQSDAFFRDLLALSLCGGARLKRFTVVDPTQQVAQRFQDLLGPECRDRFHHYQGTFSDYVFKELKLRVPFDDR